MRVEYAGLRPHTVVVWADLSPASPVAAPAPEPEQVPISKLGQRLQATVASARERAQTRTRAQQLLDTTLDADATELFARLARSHEGLLSPSPTRAAFAPAAPRALFAGFPSPLSAPRSPSPAESSRPSSRSSTLSSTFSAGADSDSSASSVAECDAPEAKPASLPTKATRAFIAPRRAPAFVPEPTATKVVVDANKKDVTKYLYQGGVSTVLTGGVMLGAAPTPRASAPAATPRYRAPIGGRAPQHTKNASATAGSWRAPPSAPNRECIIHDPYAQHTLTLPSFFFVSTGLLLVSLAVSLYFRFLDAWAVYYHPSRAAALYSFVLVIVLSFLWPAYLNASLAVPGRCSLYSVLLSTALISQ